MAELIKGKKKSGASARRTRNKKKEPSENSGTRRKRNSTDNLTAAAVTELSSAEQYGRLLSQIISSREKNIINRFINISEIVDKLFGVNIVCISEIRGESLHQLCINNHGKVANDIGSCPTENTPCKTVIETRDICTYNGVSGLFPRAPYLKEFNANSYCGFPSFNASGEVVCVTSLLDEKPKEYTEEDRIYLKVIAQQISLELERKNYTEQLSTSEEKFNKAFFSSPDAITITSLKDSRIIDCNEAFLQKSGYSREELIGKSARELGFWKNPEDRKYLVKILKNLGSAQEFETSFQKQNGEVLLFSLSSSIITLKGEPCILTISKDITARKQAEEKLKLSEARMRSYYEAGLVGMAESSSDGRLTQFNDKLCEITGYSHDELMLKIWKELTHPDDRKEERDKYNRVLAGDLDGYSVNKRIIKKDGNYIDVILSTKCSRMADGTVDHFVSFIQDITDRTIIEQEAEELRFAVNNAVDAIYLTTEGGQIFYVNNSACEQLGYSRDELLNMNVGEIDPTLDDEMRERYRQDSADGGLHIIETIHKRKDGSIFPVELTYRSNIGKDKVYSFAIVRDITERKEMSEKLSHQAMHDSLTDLINRREFEHRLERILETSRKDSSEHALCYLDLDQFKVINDTCGHVAGDELLRQLSDLLQREVRKRDTLARLGGDEFGVLMEHCSLEQAQRVASNLLKAIEDFRFTWEDKSFSIEVSIGLTPIDNTSLSSIEIMKQADAACYAAKDAGRNRIHIYREDDTALARRHGEMQWVARINLALLEDRFCLYAQPIKSLKRKSKDGKFYELLLRMKDEDGELIRPGAFLAGAERYSLSTRLDRWVVDNTFEILKTNPSHLEQLSHCTINLSGLSLGDDKFLDFLLKRLKEDTFPPEKICFEITETAAITNLSRATTFINILKSWGCYFALDDFGSGLSSFAYLKNLPVDYLKIDGVFIKDIEQDEIDLAMVHSINEIGKVMGKKTIAEFVENERILKKLKKIGIDYAQGFYIGKPQPLENMLRG